MGHSLKPSVHPHLDSHKRAIDGKSKFSIRVDINGIKRTYPVDTKGDQELYMERKYWVEERCPDTDRKLKTRRILHVKGNSNSKGIERILDSKLREMEKLINSLAESEKSITHELLRRMWAKKDTTSFSDWYQKWYTAYSKDLGLKSSTVENADCVILAIKQFESLNGVKKVSEISVDWLCQFQNWLYRERKKDSKGRYLGKGFSPNTAAGTMKKIGVCIKHANLDGVIFTNVYRDFFDRGLYRSPETVIGTMLEREEVARLQKAFDNKELVTMIKTRTGAIAGQGQKLHHLLGMFLFTCYTGLRYGDLCRVANGHEDVRIGERILTIKMEKTRQPLRLKINQKMRGVANLTGEGPVFETRILNNWNMNKNLRRICTLLGIDTYVTMHGLRRTFATMLLGMGERLKIVSSLLGHKSVLTTENHYAKVSDLSMEEAMDRFDQTYSEFTKPSVAEFVEDVFRLLSANEGLKIPRRMKEKLDSLTQILHLKDIEEVDVSGGNPRIEKVA